IGRQRSRSSFTTPAKPTGVSATASSPIVSRLLCTSPCAVASAMPLARRLTMSAGVFAGAKKPSHGAMAMSGKPDSTKVGTSGRKRERCALLTASTRILPPPSCGSTSESGLMLTGTWPPIRSCSAGALAVLHRPDAGAPRSADAVLDDHRRRIVAAQLVGDQAREDIGAAAGGKRHDDAHLLGGGGLGERPRRERQRGRRGENLPA